MFNMDLLSGTVKVRISGLGTERFFNIASQRGLYLCDIAQNEDGSATFWTKADVLKQMNFIRRKTGVRLRITERKGIPFWIAKNKGRKLMIAGFLSFFLFVYQWSFYIWDITFENNLRYSDQTMLVFMETLGIENGMKKSEISCENLEAELRDHFPDITWVSAELVGTRLVVSVRENETLQQETEQEKFPCHLIAEKDGFIVRSVVRSGILQVRNGDTVKKGQVLVHGELPILDDTETLIKTNLVHADGEIYAETTEHISLAVPAIKEKHVRTGKMRRGFLLGGRKRILYVMFPSFADTQWEYVMEQVQIRLFRNFYIPVYIGRISAYEICSYDYRMTRNQAQMILDVQLAEYMEKLTEKGVQILGSDGRIEQDESGWHYTGTLRLLEDVAVEAAISENQEENQTVNECN